MPVTMVPMAVVVDVQNDFVKGGALPYGYPSEDVVPFIVDRVRDLVAEKRLVVATMDTHSDVFYENTLESKMVPRHCIDGTPGWDMVERLKPLIPGDRWFRKITFGLTRLPALLEGCSLSNNGVPYYPEEIRMLGGCASICLASNALILRAAYPDVPIIVESSLCFDVDEAAFVAAMKVLANNNIKIE